MNQRGGHGPSWRTSWLIAIGIVVGLLIIGKATGATPLAVTPKGMAQAMRAVHYPAAHPKRLTCRRARSRFRCVARWGTRHRRFYAAELGGGWLTAGKTKMLQQGFYPARLAKPGWQTNVVSDWIFLKTGASPGTISCTGTQSPMTCADIYTFTYKRVGSAYLETVTG